MKRKGITWRDPKLVDEQSPLTCQQSKLNKNKTQQQPAPELLLKCGLRPVKLCKLPPIITKDSGTPFHLPFSLKMQHARGRAGRGPPDTGRPGLSAGLAGQRPSTAAPLQPRGGKSPESSPGTEHPRPHVARKPSAGLPGTAALRSGRPGGEGMLTPSRTETEADGNDPVRWLPGSRARGASPQRVGLGQRGSAGSFPLWLGPLATRSTPLPARS